jgi:hypothetical protein
VNIDFLGTLPGWITAASTTTGGAAIIIAYLRRDVSIKGLHNADHADIRDHYAEELERVTVRQRECEERESQLRGRVAELENDILGLIRIIGQPTSSNGSAITATRSPSMAKAAVRRKLALIAAFANPKAPAVTEAEIAALATRLGCSMKQLRAVATVESGRSAFDTEGRPKMLFERHKFNRFTNGHFPMSAWNNPMAGGYGEDSWNKLAHAACQDADSAFSAASWGRFQVLGQYWQGLATHPAGDGLFDGRQRSRAL